MKDEMQVFRDAAAISLEERDLQSTGWSTVWKIALHARLGKSEIISSLLDLQAQTIGNEQVRSLFQDSQHRIRSMALIHEQLYQSQDLANIDFADYIDSLINHLKRSQGYWGQEVAVNLGIAPTLFSI